MINQEEAAAAWSDWLIAMHEREAKRREKQTAEPPESAVSPATESNKTQE